MLSWLNWLSVSEGENENAKVYYDEYNDYDREQTCFLSEKKNTHLSFRLRWAKIVLPYIFVFFVSTCYLSFSIAYQYFVLGHWMTVNDYEWEIKCKYVIFHDQLLKGQWSQKYGIL